MSPFELPAEPVFAEPWQAQVFAMVVALHERGLFTWAEWAAALSARIKSDTGADYYHNWLTALEDVLAEKGVGSKAELSDIAAAWTRAAEATPHGQPIRLENDPAKQRTAYP